MPEPVRVEAGPDRAVTAMIYRAAGPARSDIGLILGHGAGAGQTSSFMVTFATELAARGIDTVTFNFSYMEQRRRLPDPRAVLEACYRKVIATVRHHDIGHRGLAIGGKSMGGRIASHVAAAAPEVAALVLLGYPLHPPGAPDKLRASHLADIRVPMLFVQGSRDAFGTPEELRPIIATLQAPCELHVVEGGDHSFKVPKRAGAGQDETYRAILDRIAGWLRDTVGADSACSGEV
ncbi:MAG: alpha/beta family hydrolase [Xanthobacteraceae bacterium]